ncbi:Protein angel 2 [Rhizophlyctis rosea]|nr:Protein angel 2 [Rhizophlyctis rosea]
MVPNLLQHPLKFDSAYAPYRDPDTSVEYTTTWHDQGKETVDYIFYSSAPDDSGDAEEDTERSGTHLKLLGYLKPPAGNYLRKMPNPNSPSDHACLIAEFEMGV